MRTIYRCPECREPLDGNTTTYVQVDVDEWTWKLAYDDTGLKLQPHPTFCGVDTERYYVHHACGANIACDSNKYVTFDSDWFVCSCGQLNEDGGDCINCGRDLDESSGEGMQ